MKDHWIKALLAVVEAGTIRGAARTMNLSQAALTKALRELEQEAGVELLARSYRGVRLTKAGRILHDRARAARHQLRIAEEEIRALSGGTQETLSVGVTPMVALSVLPDVWTHFRRLRPGVTLNLMEGLPSLVTPALTKGELDFAVVMAEPELLPATLQFEPLTQTRFMVVGREAHPSRGISELATLLEQDHEWIFSLHLGSYSERVLNWMTSLGMARPRRIVDSNSTLSNWQLPRSTDMLSIMPAVFFEPPSVGAQASGLAPFDIPLPPAEVGILRLRHAPPSASADLLAELFSLYLQKLTGASAGPA